MFYIFIVSLIWGFSFGIIKHQLAGIDSSWVSFMRLLISLIVFLPFLNRQIFRQKIFFSLLFIGALQYGVMYLFYIESFRFLAAHEVALYTIFTPVYIVLIHKFIKRKTNLYYLSSAILAVLGAFALQYRFSSVPASYLGFLFVQISNLAFAFGQVGYKLLDIDQTGLKQHQIFGILFLGGVFVTALPVLIKGTITPLNSNQVLSLLYLGIVPSAAGFFLWNYGARKTNTGMLSVFNNLKIPLAVLTSFIFFGEDIKLLSLSIGSALLLAALLLNKINHKPLICCRTIERNPL